MPNWWPVYFMATGVMPSSRAARRKSPPFVQCMVGQAVFPGEFLVEMHQPDVASQRGGANMAVEGIWQFQIALSGTYAAEFAIR